MESKSRFRIQALNQQTDKNRLSIVSPNLLNQLDFSVSQNNEQYPLIHQQAMHNKRKNPNDFNEKSIDNFMNQKSKTSYDCRDALYGIYLC